MPTLLKDGLKWVNPVGTASGNLGSEAGRANGPPLSPPASVAPACHRLRGWKYEKGERAAADEPVPAGEEGGRKGVALPTGVEGRQSAAPKRHSVARLRGVAKGFTHPVNEAFQGRKLCISPV